MGWAAHSLRFICSLGDFESHSLSRLSMINLNILINCLMAALKAAFTVKKKTPVVPAAFHARNLLLYRANLCTHNTRLGCRYKLHHGIFWRRINCLSLGCITLQIPLFYERNLGVFPMQMHWARAEMQGPFNSARRPRCSVTFLGTICGNIVTDMI